MKKRLLLLTVLVMALVCALAISASAAAPLPAKPDLGVDFGTVTKIDGFTPPSQLFVNTTERVLLVDGEGNYVTYPTYYITKDSTTFDVDFSKLNTATGITYSKASVVMIELPHGIVELKNIFTGTNYASCLYIQIPGSITTCSDNLFNCNKACKIVEFVDGTEPLTLGNGLFSGAWNGGPVIEYVKFPNNLVAIGNNTFGKATSSKTIIFGENLASIGTNFFSEATPNTTDTFLYVSPNFYKDTSGMFTNLFGELNQFHNKHLRLTMFYTGTKAEAEAFVTAGKALQSGYVFDNVNYVSAEEYVYETHKPTQNGNLVIIYDYDKCDAFYNGHLGEDYDCTTENTCTRCGNVSPKEADTHNIIKSLAYANGFDNVGVYNCYCDRAGCTMAGTEVRNAEKDPIITFKGYSTPETGNVKGINAGFKVEKDLLTLYNDLNEVDATLTIFMVNSKSNDVNISKILDGDTLELADGVKGINVKITSVNYTSISVEVRGFDDSEGGSFYTLNLITAIAVKTADGVHYVQAGLKNSPNTTQTVDGVDFNIVTANKVYNPAS